MTIRAQLSDVRSDATTNLDLWIDRFPAEHGQEAVRQHNLNAVQVIGVPDGYKAAFRRRELTLGRFAAGYEGGETRFFRIRLDGRAILGLGAASVRETGCTLLRPWGVPCIPGSALKGLAAHTAHASGGEWERSKEAGGDAGPLHQLLFGDVQRAGAVVFHDAWWVPDSRLGVHTDTMTVHHAEYYKGKGAPSDTDEPTPVSFLSISGSYQVALSGPPEALDVATAILRRGLRDAGIGAKTAAGYGRASLEEHTPDPPPLSLDERLERELAGHSAWRPEVQARWLLKEGREPRVGASESEWRASLKQHHPEGIAHLRVRGENGSVDQLRLQLEEHRAKKPKQKKGKDFKAWKKESDRLEKDIAKGERATVNRQKEAEKAQAFLTWLDGSESG